MTNYSPESKRLARELRTKAQAHIEYLQSPEYAAKKRREARKEWWADWWPLFALLPVGALFVWGLTVPYLP